MRHEPHIEELSLPSSDVVHVHVGDGDREHVLIGVVVVVIVILADFVSGVARDLKFQIKLNEVLNTNTKRLNILLLLLLLLLEFCVFTSQETEIIIK